MRDKLMVMLWVFGLLVLLGGGIYVHFDGPCWLFKYSHVQDIPARCISEFVK